MKNLKEAGEVTLALIIIFTVLGGIGFFHGAKNPSAVDPAKVENVYPSGKKSIGH